MMQVRYRQYLTGIYQVFYLAIISIPNTKKGTCKVLFKYSYSDKIFRNLNLSLNQSLHLKIEGKFIFA